MEQVPLCCFPFFFFFLMWDPHSGNHLYGHLANAFIFIIINTCFTITMVDGATSNSKKVDSKDSFAPFFELQTADRIRSFTFRPSHSIHFCHKRKDNFILHRSSNARTFLFHNLENLMLQTARPPFSFLFVFIQWRVNVL